MNTYGIEMTTAEKVAAHMATRTTKQLIGDLIMSGIMMDAVPEKFYDRMPTVRGWIMDELKRRDPIGYNDWIDNSSEDDDAWAFFHC